MLGGRKLNIHRVLISVWDKTGILDFVSALSGKGIEIIATQGTASFLASHNIPVKPIEELTGSSNLLDGSLKTIHHRIFAAILAKSTEEHIDQLKKLGVEPIDMVVVNLRPLNYESTTDEKQLLERIDIGGVALLRAAAKNYRNVVPVCDYNDFKEILDSIEKCGDITLYHRRKLCVKAFKKCAEYDMQVSQILAQLFAVEL
ncbi:IMP cyclohydrolase [Pseudothermotoga thermarum]|uniref:IMP cyclohydrolase n=1 Tax=Pseudothermotoga thermarum TaxID=119394 RepID=UPI001FE0CEDE|nr:IMP cyclohydrolase [Pseudothermotoga thermarum]